MTTTDRITKSELTRLGRALPFWASLLLVPLAWLAAVKGGWYIALLPLATWHLFTLLDALLGRYNENADPETETAELFWYRAITLIWTPVQAITIFGILFHVSRSGHLHQPRNGCSLPRSASPRGRSASTTPTNCCTRSRNWNAGWVMCCWRW